MTSRWSGLRLLRLTTDASHHGADHAPRQGDRSVLELWEKLKCARSVWSPQLRSRWCRSLGDPNHPGPSRRASRRTDQSVADLLPMGVQLSARPCWRVKPEHGSSSRGVQVMLNSAAIARPFRVSEMHREPRGVNDDGPKLVQFLNRVHDQNANPTSLLNRYIEGWAAEHVAYDLNLASDMLCRASALR